MRLAELVDEYVELHQAEPVTIAKLRWLHEGHYGHLARNSREHAVAPLDALALERAVDAAWTSNRSRAMRLATAIRTPIGEGLTVVWTLGGRRGSFSPPLLATKGADKQVVREALSGTRTLDPLLTMEVLYQLS